MVTKDMPKAKHNGFEAIKSTSGLTLWILKSDANHTDSKRLLGNEGLRLVYEREILPILAKEDKLRHRLEGNSMWLGGTGINKSGTFAIGKDGSMKRPSIFDSSKHKVDIFKGDNPLMLDVYSPKKAENYRSCYALFANTDPGIRAQIVIGVAVGNIDDSDISALSMLR